LSSAILLGQKGKSVVVLEQAGKPGGYLHSFRRFGELYDTGAHYVGAMGPGQPFRTLLEYLGVFDEALFCELDPTGFDVFNFPFGTVALPQGYENVVRELGAIFPNERVAIRSYFSMVAKVIRFFPTYEFNDEANLEIPAEAFEVSLASVVTSLTSNQHLQCVLYAYCNLHGVKPADVAFGFHAIVTDSLLRGPYGLAEGGGDALVERFTARIAAVGGRVLTKQRVVELKVHERNITEVITENGESYMADWVISSIHPKQTFRLLSDHQGLSPAFFSRLNHLQESTAIFGVYTTIASALLPSTKLNPARNYYFFKSDRPEEMFQENFASEEPSVVFLTSPKRRLSLGSEKHPLCLHAPGPMKWFEPWRDEKYGKRSQSYIDFKKSYTEKIFSLAGRYNTELGRRLRDSPQVSSTALTNVHFNSAEEGSAYGIYHSMQNTGPRALGPRTKILNLLLTGQNGLFPGLLGAAVSALRTCGHIIGIKPVLAELKRNGRNR
jgi:all-trans-retinol 13,14-reductase